MNRCTRTARRTHNAARAAGLRAIAGTTAGLRQSRRGSFLVLVVGTLALLAVVTVVYVTIGRGDKQTSAAVVWQDKRDDPAHTARNHIAGVIADDLFDSVYLNERTEIDPDPNKTWRHRREAWDYPSTPLTIKDPETGSVRLYTSAEFTPTGDGTGADPWLASSEPALHNYDRSSPAESDPTLVPEERRDLPNISNFAPDGAFVNLANLRDAFDAHPQAMREGLSLLGPRFDDPRQNSRTDYGGPLVTSTDPEQALPAQWSTRQVAAFRPALENLSASVDPVDPDYLPNQWADADGDGMYDARWIELVESRVANEITEWILPPEDGVRYFLAITARDLSSRINLNTATDVTAGPSAADPLGLYPSAVDARTLITLQHYYENQRLGFAYDLHEQPADDTLPSYYGAYDASAAYEAGEHAYDGLRMVLDTGVMPGKGFAGLVTLGGAQGVEREFSAPYWSAKGWGPGDYYERQGGLGWEGAPGAIGSNVDLARPFGLDSLAELLVYPGVNDDREVSPLEAVLGGRRDTGTNSVDPFSPLRDNRPTSLERDGRYTAGATSIDADAMAWAYTDLRRDITTISGARPLWAGSVAPGAAIDPATDLKLNLDEVLDGPTPEQDVFKIVSDAMLPYSDIRDAWKPVSRPEYNTLVYGHRGAEHALRTVAHLTANLTDAYDTDDTPSRRTVLIDGSQQFRKQSIMGPGGRVPAYPWLLLDLDEDLASGQSRLADQQSEISAKAINVFGIEAQPFVVEAASYIMYTDTPQNAPVAGDDDTGTRSLNGIDVYTRIPSIDGRTDLSTGDNPDVLFEVIAFQVHNPFDATIDLRGDDDGTSHRIGQYYIQYGDRYYKIAPVDFATQSEIPGQAITLTPRETKVFYVLSGDPQDIIDRANNAINPDLSSQTIDNWIIKQLGTSARAVRLAEFDPASGALTFRPGVNGYDNLQNHGAGADRKAVRLWRIEKPELDPDNPGVSVAVLDESSTNDQANDTLVDRLRDPTAGGPVLDRHLDPSPGQTGRISGADKGPEPPSSNASPDNRGLTITRWGVLKRRDDPRAGQASDPPAGGLPAYCIEAKDPASDALDNIKNFARTDGSGSSLSIADFSGDNGAKTLVEALREQSDAADPAGPVVKTMKLDPEDKLADYAQPAREIIGANLAGRPFQGDATNAPLYVEPHLHNDEFKIDTDGDNVGDLSILRVADVLLPLGIGPHEVPTATDEDVRWTTLSEALAYALYYDNPSTTESIYADAFVPPAQPTDREVLLDTAHLRYDAFVTFYDADADGLFDPSQDDERWGLGVPAAANILDRFTTLPPRFASINRATPGQINVNTATLGAARSLPMLSPPPDTDALGFQTWWWAGSSKQDQHSDGATTMLGYRDRVAIFPRDLGGEPLQALNFRDWWSDPFDPFSSRVPPPQGLFPPGEEQLFADNARWGATGVAAIREKPGFFSLGELAIVRDLSYTTGSDPNYPSPHDLDRLGYDAKDVDRRGVDTVAYDPDSNGTFEDDGIADDYDERLAILNALLSTASVRSDVFAVWFVMHGYRESDVNNLGDDEPMLPSIARRFLMVVDRSNVINPGDKPRILMFREVPL